MEYKGNRFKETEKSRLGWVGVASILLVLFGLYLYSDYSNACLEAVSAFVSPEEYIARMAEEERLAEEQRISEELKKEEELRANALNALEEYYKDHPSFEHDFSPVQESDPVDDTYFEDAVFIGDSQIQGLQIYSGITTGTFYAEKGMSVYNILTKDIVYKQNGSYCSIPEALETTKFSKVYVKLGLNELASSLDDIVEHYAAVMDEIKGYEPDATIYLISVFPVTKYKDTNSQFKNSRIQSLNSLLKRMCFDNDIHYLDAYDALSDENGNLPSEASSDGVHLNRSYSAILLDYLKTHTVQVTDFTEVPEADVNVAE